MSDQPDAENVYDQIQDALTQDADGGSVTGWLLIAGHVSQDGEQNWSYYTPGDQLLMVSRGLAETLCDILKYEQWRDLQDRERRDEDL